MIRHLLVLTAIGICSHSCTGQDHVRWIQGPAGKILFSQSVDGTFILRKRFESHFEKDSMERIRWTAVALDAGLGTFGMHRIYLGTDVKVPVFYTCTLGGGMVLWLADLGLLIGSRDITPFMNNGHIFMWTP